MNITLTRKSVLFATRTTFATDKPLSCKFFSFWSTRCVCTLLKRPKQWDFLLWYYNKRTCDVQLHPEITTSSFFVSKLKTLSTIRELYSRNISPKFSHETKAIGHIFCEFNEHKIYRIDRLLIRLFSLWWAERNYDQVLISRNNGQEEWEWAVLANYEVYQSVKLLNLLARHELYHCRFLKKLLLST